MRLLGIEPRAPAWKADMLPLHYKRKKSTSAGFEPTRAEPNGLAVHLLNHSDMMP